MMAYLQTANPLQDTVTYRWQFGDDSVDHTEHLLPNATSVVTHDYESMMEAGFTLTVTASTNSGLLVTGHARVIIYREIQSMYLDNTSVLLPQYSKMKI